MTYYNHTITIPNYRNIQILNSFYITKKHQNLKILSHLEKATINNSINILGLYDNFKLNYKIKYKIIGTEN